MHITYMLYYITFVYTTLHSTFPPVFPFSPPCLSLHTFYVIYLLNANSTLTYVKKYVKFVKDT